MPGQLKRAVSSHVTVVIFYHPHPRSNILRYLPLISVIAGDLSLLATPIIPASCRTISLGAAAADVGNIVSGRR